MGKCVIASMINRRPNLFVPCRKMGIIWKSNFEEAIEGGSNVIPVKTGK
jgi:hypothetical protein